MQRATSHSPVASGRTATRTGPGFLLALCALLLILTASACLSLALGSRPIPFGTVWEALTTQLHGTDQAIVRDNRLPRTLAGIVVGAGLGAAGALMQALTRNPLAEPGLLGVNAGAALAVVLGAGILGAPSAFAGALSGTLGALCTAGLVSILAFQRSDSTDVVRLTLAGVALSAVLLSIARALALANPHAFDRLRAWQLGSIDVRTLDALPTTALFVGLGLALACALGSALDAIDLGDANARSLGVNVPRAHVLSVIAVALTAGAATALAGGVAFVGLLTPHLVRRFTGRNQRRIILASMPAAAALTLLADVVGRLIAPGELPVGVVIALVGGPVLIALARSRNLREL